MREKVEFLGGLLELVGAIGAAALMCGCFAFGFVEIGGGLGVAYRGLFAGGQTAAAGATLINATLSGLEMFFLAPLPFLAFFSTSQLFRAVVSRSEEKLRSSQVLMAKVKQLITGLMIAVVATELIHRITAGAELTRLVTVAAISLIAVLSLYHWLVGGKDASSH
jgi:hypothetical protein